jgi:formylglycine-generating enzyme required for sulfatase activity
VAASAATALDAGSRERTSEPPARASAKDAAPAQVPLLPVALPDAVAAGDDAGAGAAAGGEFCDPTSGLCWQDPPAPTSMSWDDAIAYCRRLALAGHGAGEWHLPTIDELRSLIRGCPATEPRGTCAVTDPSCLGAGCWTEVCSGCSRNGGPGAGGCYWPEGLAGSCSWYWSSSSYAGSASYAWYVYFNYGGVHFYGKTYTHYVRCVRRGPRLGL